MVFVDKVVDGSGFNNFTKMILNALLKGGVLTMEDMSKKLLCFKIEEMNVFQSVKTNIDKKIQEFFSIISMGVHYVVHKTNLVL